jgi:hypothetical protein
MSKAAETNTPTLTNKQQLYKIVVDPRGNPDALAINLYWDEFRSWYNHKKIHTSSKIIRIPKLYKYGVYASYKELSEKYGVTENTIRRKIVKLEKLELLTRDFYTNKESHKVLYNQLIIYIWQQTPHFFNPIGLDRMLIEELTPSTNHEYISSKYHNENKGGCKQDNPINVHTPIITNDHTPLQQNKDTPSTKFVHTPTPLQAINSLGLEVEGGVIANVHTPIIAGDDTNILRVNNLYNEGIERLFTYNINNTHARGFNDKTDKTDFANKNNNIDQSVHTNSVEIKTLNIEEKEASYADFAFGFPAEPTQSAFDEWEESQSDNLLALLNEEQPDDFKIPLDPEDITADEQATRKMLLSKALWQTFGTEKADEIQDHYAFVETDDQKVCIQTEEMLLNDIDRAKIRKCIQSVYGKDVTIALQIITSLPKEPIQEANQNISTTTQSNLLTFKSKLLTYNMQQMLSNPVVKVIETPSKIIIDTVAFLIERMTAPGNLDDLERAVVETGLTLELHTKNVHPEYLNFHKEPIILTPEKILEDKAWLENMRITGSQKEAIPGRLIEVKEEKSINTPDSEPVTDCNELELTAREKAIIDNFNDMTLLALIESQTSQYGGKE